MRTTRRTTTSTLAALTAALGFTACGGSSTTAPVGPPGGQPAREQTTQQACAEAPEITAERIKQEISAALPAGYTWQSSGPNIYGAYDQIVLIKPPTQYATGGGSDSVDLFHTPALAAKAAADYVSTGTDLVAYADGCVVVSAPPQASNAELAAVQAHH